MSNEYEIKSIKTLSAVEHLRLRPGMWIGSTSSEGILHLLSEVIDNSVDEFNEGRGNRISIYIDQSKSNDIITVRDYGSGIPSGVTEDGENTLTKIFTKLFTGGKFEDAYASDVSGMNGVGVKAVNALSSVLKVDSYYNGVRYHQEFRKGIEYTPVVEHGTAKESGTKITFIPDPDIFKDARISIEDVIQKGKYLSSVKPNLQIDIQIKNQNQEIQEYSFKEEKELDSILNEGRIKSEDFKPLLEFSYFSDNVRVRLEYQTTSSSSLKSFCNTVYTRDGGYHEDSVISVLLNCVKKLTGRNISKSLILQGLNCVISVYKKNPIYRGQNKTRIADEDIKKFVYEELYQPVYDELSKRKKFLKYITEISQAQEKAIEESALKAVSTDIKSRSRDNQLPENLVYVQKCNPEKRELIITEGLSASGGVAKARLTEFQEVLPIKGKCLNLIKSGMTKALDNAEVQNIFLAIGGMEGTNTKLRTHNVLILSDSDADGCIAGNTVIPLLSGSSIPIKDLINNDEFWVYSCTPEGHIVPGKAHNVRITKKIDRIYRVLLDNDKYIECTGNHPFMMRDGTYKRADELKAGNSLMPLYRKKFNDRSLVKEIQVVTLDEPIEVYDMTVDEYHNFAVGSGVFVHNSHIVSLIESMFIMAFPSFVEEHGLYVIKTALFCATDGKRRTYGQTAKQAGARFKKEFKSENFYIQRNKGIGEMSPVDLRYFIDPKTRTVEKIILGENSKEEIKKLMGEDSTYRRMLMSEIDEEIYNLDEND